MSLIENWNIFATEQQEGPDPQRFWNDYFLKEKAMYEKILTRKTAVTGTVTALAKKFGVDEVLMTGFLDGINDSLKKPIDLENMESETEVSLAYDKEKLYYNMVAAKAQWLYELPQWENHLTEEKRKELYRMQKQSKTVINTQKVGRNDPCPCGSGKKYKKCCGQ
ncbi:MAG: SEC-C metal-binding domain-containing protein [Oscillospiraceae bacterium]